jgi:mRNA interferase MazF
MAGRLIQRGEIWQLDLGYAGKIRPVLVVSIAVLDTERALVTYVPRTTKEWGTRFEVPHKARNFLPGVFDVQNIGSAPFAAFQRKLTHLDDSTLAVVEDKLRLSLHL